MHPESNTHSSISSPLLVNELFPLKSISSTTVSAQSFDYSSNTTQIIGDQITGEMINNMDRYLSDVIVLYNTEPDPEACTEKYQEIADRYPDLFRFAYMALDIKSIDSMS